MLLLKMKYFFILEFMLSFESKCGYIYYGTALTVGFS
jgi:hypothetical protein